jgi:hypothetical protein
MSEQAVSVISAIAVAAMGAFLLFACCLGAVKEGIEKYEALYRRLIS